MSSGLQRTIEELRATIEAQERTIEVLSDEVERRQASVTASAFTIWSQNLALESIVEKKTENLRAALEEVENLHDSLLQSNAQLEESECFLLSIVDAFPAPMCILDSNREIVQTNVAWRELAWSRRSIFHGVSDGDSYDRIARRAASVEGGELFDLVERSCLCEMPADATSSETSIYRWGDGDESTWYQVQLRQLSVGEGRVILAHVDVTSRMLAEIALHQEHELLELVLENIPHAVYWKDIAGSYLGCNGAFASNIARRAEDEIIGHTDEQIFEMKQREHFAWLETESVITQGEAEHGARQNHWDGETTRQYITSKVPLVDELGQLSGVLGICADITEFDALEQQLYQARKLEAVGQLSAGIAHEINTPLQYVGDNLHFLEKSNALLLEFANRIEEIANEEEGEVDRSELAGLLKKARFKVLKKRLMRSTESALEGVEAVSKIVRAMKGFAHPGSHEKKKACLNSSMETTLAVARNEWKYVAEVELDLDPNLPLVECDIAELNQVFLNLVVNACHAIESARDGESEELGLIRIQTRQHDEEQVELRFSDNGTGIGAEHLDRIFEQFFTTKEVGKGTGQGLAISRRVIVNRHHGEIWCESAPGQGATFVIRLPIHARKEEEAA